MATYLGVTSAVFFIWVMTFLAQNYFVTEQTVLYNPQRVKHETSYLSNSIINLTQSILTAVAAGISADTQCMSEASRCVTVIFKEIMGIAIYLDQKVNFSAASNVCNQLNLQLARKDQVEEALKRGFETCNFGWVEEQFVVIPRITSNPRCGQGKTGLAQWKVGLHQLFHVYCFNSSDVQINSCEPDPTTTAFPSSSASTDLTAYSASDLTENITAVPTVTVTESEKFLRKRLRVVCVTETILPTEEPTTQMPEEHSPTVSPKHTPHLAFKNDAVVFGGIPTTLLVLAIIFFLISVVLAVCYIKKYKKTLPFFKKNQQKETVVTTALKETKSNDQTPEKETQNNGNKVEECKTKPEATVKCLEAEV